mmetsp:Transcript_888/g.1998  ORF Transcript_888/g.1998 Transcript_888/m.1998 type:complete len:231 (+) Transcript_888:378-1070(+)
MRRVTQQHCPPSLGDPWGRGAVLIHAELEAPVARLGHRHDLLRDARPAQPIDAVLPHVARFPVGILGSILVRVRKDDRDHIGGGTVGSARAVRASERIDTFAEPLMELARGARRPHTAGGHHPELHADPAVRWRRHAASLSVGVALLDVVANARGEAVGTYHQVEALARPIVEDQVDTVLVLIDGDQLPAQPHRPLRKRVGQHTLQGVTHNREGLWRAGRIDERGLAAHQ